MNFGLPSTGTEQPPAFVTAAACHDWLTTIPLTNAMQAQAMFLRQLTLLTRFTLPKTERLAILETLRGPVRDAQESMVKKFVTRPLPFSPPEQAALDSTLAVWQALLINYLHCLEEARGDSGKQSKKIATVAQRTLAILADWQIDLIRGERLPDTGYWKKLHQIFATVESLGLAEQKINDSLRHGKVPVSPLAIYAECHLLYVASPYELPARDLAWIARWARRWGNKIALLAAPPEDIRHCAHPLWVDLDSDQPADYVPHPAANGRWLETTALRTSLTTRLALLEQGHSPADLQLGNDVTQPTAGKLLARLLQRWCQGGSARRAVRRSTSGSCRFIAGFDAVHFHFSGRRTFQPPTQDDASLRREREKFEIFGDRSHRLDVTPPQPDSAPIENWEIMDDWRLLDASANGLRISRPLKEGARIGAGLLVAIRTAQSEAFILGCVRWALRQDTDSLAIGIQLFPGEPHAVAVRPIESDRTPYRPAFLVAADESAGEPASLILPVGSFQIGRRLEIMRQTAEVVTLTHLIDYGSEFERCTYEP